ncbi:MAG: YqaE/Pmp3 family membrane protein [Muribaculaceae bacterium]|nr:YqaE/Pmp3 family membrane protein [Muribaculaceae bacterium]
MSCFRVLLAIIFPPLAVLDKGCGSVLIVLLLTAAGWIPGVIGALVILNKNTNVPNNNQPTYPTNYYNNRTRCDY